AGGGAGGLQPRQRACRRGLWAELSANRLRAATPPASRNAQAALRAEVRAGGPGTPVQSSYQGMVRSCVRGPGLRVLERWEESMHAQRRSMRLTKLALVAVPAVLIALFLASAAVAG